MVIGVVRFLLIRESMKAIITNNILKDTNSTLKHCQNILKIVRIEPLMALGMITVFVNVMTKESMITVMNQKIS